MPTFAQTDKRDFKSRVHASINRLISEGRDFSIDDVWRDLALSGIDMRAPDSATVGAIVNSYRRRGLIQNTGMSAISQRGPAKGRRVSVWRVAQGGIA